MKKFTVAVAGLGARGYSTYAQYQHLHPERMQITAIADVNPERVKNVAEEFGVPKERCFQSAEEMLKQGKLADVLFIATQDRQHLSHTLAALENGYDILLEKPIASSPYDCIAIRDAAAKAGKLVVVCHVLRYTDFFNTIKNVIAAGRIGDVVTVQQAENVGYWHYAHSFVRGNWRNSDETSPMILQKCCHDFDIMSWMIGKKCLSLSSFGSLKYFRKENAPAGSAKMCMECALMDTCPYSAPKIYLDNPEIGLRHGNASWPCNIVVERPTEERLLTALRTSPYGRCVFRSDNNVVDHEVTTLQFEDDITATLTMTGFTAFNTREIKVMGTEGEIVANQHTNLIEIRTFGKETEVVDINKTAKDLSGHGGGDNAMLSKMFDTLDNGGGNVSSTIENSVHSHLVAFAAEHSRLAGGALVRLDEYDEMVKSQALEK